jgi:SAM-dependent methyltransferase
MTDGVQSCCCDFAAQYEQNAHPAFKNLEQSVLGCDYGGTSWTTRDQADGIGSLLALGQDVELLELGSGAGWPSVYLADESGCRLTLLDLPEVALQQARFRAEEDGLGSIVSAISASAAQLPLAGSSFDALCHSDVLCCLPEKQEMLNECRRVARAGARMLFYVIAPAEGLNEEDMAESIDAGPPFVGLQGDYATMLNTAGWRILQRKSVTDDYLASLEKMVEGMLGGESELIALMGPGEFAESLQRRRHQVSAVDRGLLVREMFLVEPL